LAKKLTFGDPEKPVVQMGSYAQMTLVPNVFLSLPELDEPIIFHLTLPSIFNLSCTNRHYEAKLNGIREHWSIKDHMYHMDHHKRVCMYDVHQIVKYLDKKGCIGWASGDVFMICCTHDSINSAKVISRHHPVRSMLTIGSHHRDFTLRKAICSSSFQMVKYLIALMEDVYGKYDIHAEPTLLADVSATGSVEMLDYFIRLGENGYGRFDIHMENDAPIRKAMKYKHPAIIYYLLRLSVGSYGAFSKEICTILDSYWLRNPPKKID